MSEFVRVRSTLALMALVASTSVMAVNTPTSIKGQGTWEATLHPRDLDGNLANGPEAYYDSALNITWLADFSYYQTSTGGSGTTGVNWNSANAWVSQVNSDGIDGVKGWRLPHLDASANNDFAACVGLSPKYTTSGSACGFNVDTSKSELAYLFFVEFGDKASFNSAGAPNSSYGLTNLGPFDNPLHKAGDPRELTYWTDLAAPNKSGPAWGFNFQYGLQMVPLTVGVGILVRDGDVPSVPEPATSSLALIGLLALGFAHSRKKG